MPLIIEVDEICWMIFLESLPKPNEDREVRNNELFLNSSLSSSSFIKKTNLFPSSKYFWLMCAI